MKKSAESKTILEAMKNVKKKEKKKKKKKITFPSNRQPQACMEGSKKTNT
jgi:hypothetical protein